MLSEEVSQNEYLVGVMHETALKRDKFGKPYPGQKVDVLMKASREYGKDGWMAISESLDRVSSALGNGWMVMKYDATPFDREEHRKMKKEGLNTYAVAVLYRRTMEGNKSESVLKVLQTSATKESEALSNVLNKNRPEPHHDWVTSHYAVTEIITAEDLAG